LVTVKHVALGLSDIPFLIRMNAIEGDGSQNLAVEENEIEWFTHSDPDVDLAIAPFQFDLRKAGNDVKFISGIESTPAGPSGFECGDFCYTIGLFQLMAGHKRNLPVVHFGTIALLPSDEKIPVRDWERPHEMRTRRVEGYLVESQSIDGLSGAPVFARSIVEFTGMPTTDGNAVDVYMPLKRIGVLGVWQGAWDARPDDVFAKFVGQDVRVPVGMGVVVPARRIVEILNMPKAKEHRQKFLRDWEASNTASTNSAISPPTTDANPTS
jgi:hypothetical protein